MVRREEEGGREGRENGKEGEWMERSEGGREGMGRKEGGRKGVKQME